MSLWWNNTSRLYFLLAVEGLSYSLSGVCGFDDADLLNEAREAAQAGDQSVQSGRGVSSDTRIEGQKQKYLTSLNDLAKVEVELENKKIQRNRAHEVMQENKNKTWLREDSISLKTARSQKEKLDREIVGIEKKLITKQNLYASEKIKLELVTDHPGAPTSDDVLRSLHVGKGNSSTSESRHYHSHSTDSMSSTTKSHDSDELDQGVQSYEGTQRKLLGVISRMKKLLVSNDRDEQKNLDRTEVLEYATDALKMLNGIGKWQGGSNGSFQAVTQYAKAVHEASLNAKSSDKQGSFDDFYEKMISAQERANHSVEDEFEIFNNRKGGGSWPSRFRPSPALACFDEGYGEPMGSVAHKSINLALAAVLEEMRHANPALAGKIENVMAENAQSSESHFSSGTQSLNGRHGRDLAGSFVGEDDSISPREPSAKSDVVQSLGTVLSKLNGKKLMEIFSDPTGLNFKSPGNPNGVAWPPELRKFLDTGLKKSSPKLVSNYTGIDYESALVKLMNDPHVAQEFGAVLAEKDRDFKKLKLGPGIAPGHVRVDGVDLEIGPKHQLNLISELETLKKLEGEYDKFIVFDKSTTLLEWLKKEYDWAEFSKNSHQSEKSLAEVVFNQIRETSDAIKKEYWIKWLRNIPIHKSPSVNESAAQPSFSSSNGALGKIGRDFKGRIVALSLSANPNTAEALKNSHAVTLTYLDDHSGKVILKAPLDTKGVSMNQTFAEGLISHLSHLNVGKVTFTKNGRASYEVQGAVMGHPIVFDHQGQVLNTEGTRNIMTLPPSSRVKGLSILARAGGGVTVSGTNPGVSSGDLPSLKALDALISRVAASGPIEDISLNIHLSPGIYSIQMQNSVAGGAPFSPIEFDKKTGVVVANPDLFKVIGSNGGNAPVGVNPIVGHPDKILVKIGDADPVEVSTVHFLGQLGTLQHLGGKVKDLTFISSDRTSYVWTEAGNDQAKVTTLPSGKIDELDLSLAGQNPVGPPNLIRVKSMGSEYHVFLKGAEGYAVLSDEAKVKRLVTDLAGGGAGITKLDIEGNPKGLKFISPNNWAVEWDANRPF